MRPKKRLPVNELPAVAKRFYTFARKKGLVAKQNLPKPEQSKFWREFLTSFFKKDPWLGRIIITTHLCFFGKAIVKKPLYKGRAEQALCAMRRHFIKTGKAKTAAEADKLIEAKMQQTMQRTKIILNKMWLQRTKLAVPKYGVVYHGVNDIVGGIGFFADNVIECIQKTKGK